MAVDKKEHTFISSFTRHLRHLKSSDKIHKLEFYAEVPVGINVNENQDICSVEDELEHKMMIDKLRSYIPKLTQKQQDLVQYLYFDCLTQEETAQKLGITQSAVSQRNKTLIKKLRKLMNE